MFEDDTAAPCRVRTASGLFRLVQVRSPESAVLVPALPYVILAHHAVLSVDSFKREDRAFARERKYFSFSKAVVLP